MTVLALNCFYTFDNLNWVDAFISNNKQIVSAGDWNKLMYSHIILFDLLNGLIWIDLYAMQRSFFVCGYNHSFIPNNWSKHTFFGIGILQNKFIRQTLEGIQILIKGSCDHQMFFRNVHDIIDVQAMIVVVCFIDFESNARLPVIFVVAARLNLDLFDDVQISHWVAHIHHEVIDLTIMQI